MDRVKIEGAGEGLGIFILCICLSFVSCEAMDGITITTTEHEGVSKTRIELGEEER